MNPEPYQEHCCEKMEDHHWLDQVKMFGNEVEDNC